MRAEARKLLSARSTWGIVAGMAFVTIMGVLQTAGGQGEVGKSLTERQFWVLSVVNGSMFLAVLAIKYVTDEFRYQTIVPTLLVEPRRVRVVAGKLAVAAVAGMTATLLSMGVGLAAAYPHLGGGLTASEWGSVALFVAGAAVWTLVAGGLAFLVRHQTGAIVGAIAWVLLVEQLLASGSDRLGELLPLGALRAVAGGSATEATIGGAAILLAYAAASTAAATVAMVRRDVV